MNANIPKQNTGIRTPEEAKQAAINIAEQAKDLKESQIQELKKSLLEIEQSNVDGQNFGEIAGLLALPEEHFALLAPIFLNQLEKDFNNVNSQLEFIQIMNLKGLKVEDVRNEYAAICNNIDNSLADVLSSQKRDFLKRIVGLTYNTMAEAEGASKKTILIPIEYCNPDAKMPTYAHLTDAGMDVYLTEDITIHPGETKLIPLGIKIALPLGYELQVRPKSGRSLKSKLRIANTPGTIDAGYRDEICIIADNIDQVIKGGELDEAGHLTGILWGSDITLEKGEKIAQLVLSEVPKAVFYEVDNVSSIENDGRQGGFGSSSIYGKDDPRYGSDLV